MIESFAQHTLSCLQAIGDAECVCHMAKLLGQALGRTLFCTISVDASCASSAASLKASRNPALLGDLPAAYCSVS